jgi:glycosyltransferase involved in cell wall biosynthesis
MSSEYQNNQNICIIIPTYNNDKTLKRVIDGVLKYAPHNSVILINDGCTDTTTDILNDYQDKLTILTNETNKGKGYSLHKALRKALELGYNYAITIDSDGQHFPEDIPNFIQKNLEFPNQVIMGSRNMNQESVPGKSSFGNKFSNFWFKIETLIELPDTQTGFRLYPLEPLRKLKLFTTKFEFEIEIIVRYAWENIGFKSIPVNVLYDKEERVSHFRPGRDFFRISVLNTFLVIGALLYFFPKKLFSKNSLIAIKNEAIKADESNLTKSLSIGFGFFMGIFPIWGFQLLVGIPLSVLFRMNKVLFITAANISIPPFIPFVLYGSFLFGQLFLQGEINHQQLLAFTMDDIKTNSILYIVGAIVFALIAGILSFSLSYIFLNLFRKK